MLRCNSLTKCAIGAFLCAQFVPTLVFASAYGQDSIGSSSNTFSCDDLVVAGAGAGGLYSAWRLVQAGMVNPSKTCIFEQTNRAGGRLRSVRGGELPDELSAIGVNALDVGAYRARPVLHPFVSAVWKELRLETGCYHDIAFRTGDCTDECDPAHAIHKYLRDKYIPYTDTRDSTNDLPYTFGPSNSWNVTSSYLSPFDWLYGPYAPPFWKDNFGALALSKDSTVRWAARDAIVQAARDFEIDGTPSTLLTLEMLAANGYNSDGVYMTAEDHQFYLDNDCSVGGGVGTRASLFDTVVNSANNFASGIALGLGGDFSVPVDSDGKQMGFDIIAVRVLELLETMGVKLYYRYQVKGTSPSPRVGKHAIIDVTDLESGEQFSMETKHAVLNVPSEFILDVLSDDVIETYGRGDLYDVFRAIKEFGQVKAYPYYEDAWWAKLGYVSGRMKTTQPMYHTRYHDGYSNCTGDSFTDCSGVFLAAYVMTAKGVESMEPFFPKTSFADSSDGLITIRRGQGPTQQDDFLDAVHTQNMAAHKFVLAEIGVDTADIPVPDLCLAGVYMAPIGGVHFRLPNSLAPGTIDEAAVEPFPGYNIHLVNEAYGNPGAWLEASLYSSERVLHHYYGLDKAPWFTDDIYEGFDSNSYYNSVIGNSNGGPSKNARSPPITVQEYSGLHHSVTGSRQALNTCTKRMYFDMLGPRSPLSVGV